MSKYTETRKEGFLPQLKSSTLITRLLFFDTETHVLTDSNGYVEFPFRIGVAIYVELDKECKVKKRVTYRFRSIQEFISILETHSQKKKALYIFAHNVGFDIRVLELTRQFDKLGYSSEPPIIRSKALIWRVDTSKGSLCFLDTANYGVESVSRLGKDLNFSKMEIDFQTQDEDKLFTYCNRDVEIIETFIIDFIRFIHNHDLGSIKVTLASQAMATYRTSFMDNPPYIHLNDKALALERSSYYGGRVECFYIGVKENEPIYYLDVNSMYPYAMKHARLPVQFKGYTENVPLIHLGVRLTRYFCIAEVELETNDNVYPYRHNGKLIFPTGTFVTSLAHAELEFAYRNNHIKNIRKCAIYSYGDLFSSYVDYFYNLKQQYSIDDNKSWRLITKLFLNSLYGKFGQVKIEREELYHEESNIVWRQSNANKETGYTFSETCWYGDVWREVRGGETHFSNPAIASGVTSFARLLLYNYIKQAGVDNVFYCDTDSLMVNNIGYNRLFVDIDDNRLGMLKLEKITDYLKIYGAKDYKFGTDEKIKGIQKGSVRESENRWSYLQFQGMLSWLNDGAISNATGKNTYKERKSSYNKGIVLPDGIVKPYHFPISE